MNYTASDSRPRPEWHLLLPISSGNAQPQIHIRGAHDRHLGFHRLGDAVVGQNHVQRNHRGPIDQVSRFFDRVRQVGRIDHLCVDERNVGRVHHGVRRAGGGRLSRIKMQGVFQQVAQAVAVRVRSVAANRGVGQLGGREETGLPFRKASRRGQRREGPRRELRDVGIFHPVVGRVPIGGALLIPAGSVQSHQLQRGLVVAVEFRI